MSFSVCAFDAELVGARTLIVKDLDSGNERVTVTDNGGKFKVSQEKIKGRAVFQLPMSLTGNIDACSNTVCQTISLPPQFGGGRNN